MHFYTLHAGKGVFAGKKFPAGSFLMEYHGELISEEEGIKREKSYPIEFGSFLLYFKSRRKIMWYVLCVFIILISQKSTNDALHCAMQVMFISGH